LTEPLLTVGEMMSLRPLINLQMLDCFLSMVFCHNQVTVQREGIVGNNVVNDWIVNPSEFLSYPLSVQRGLKS
jgi:hypothetical protein